MVQVSSRSRLRLSHWFSLVANLLFTNGLLVLITCLTLSGCGGGRYGTIQQQPQQPQQPPPNQGVLTKITIDPPTSVETGEVVQLSAAGSDPYGTPVAIPFVNWTSSDSSVAYVTVDGNLVAFGPGNVTITASADPVSGSLPVTINPGITFTLGAEETVFNWNTDRCEDLDLPDVPASVIRRADGMLVMSAGDAPNNYVSVGPDFSSLKRVCTHPVLVSGDNWSADSYDNQEWVEVLYREGNVIHALVDVEYHDPVSLNCSPGDSHPGNPCWYNSITYASSTDGGLTFTYPTPPAQVVAPPWQKWDATGNPDNYGDYWPSHIVLAPDNYYYFFFNAKVRFGTNSMCAARTQTLADPTSWRAWDGTGFNLQMLSPYTSSNPTACAPVMTPPDDLAQSVLTFNTYLNQYLLVGAGQTGGPTEWVCGFYYKLSTDLIHWTPLRLLRTATAWGGPCLPGTEVGVVYASIIDHNDTTPNFERSGRTPYLYYARDNGGLDRDLVRVPMTITEH